MREKGATVTIFNRSKDRGEALSRDFDVSFGGTLDDFNAENFSILINATSAGFRDAQTNPAEGMLAPHLLVMDIAFIPAETKLIVDAKAAGCETVNGTRMLVHQACGQVELYTGVDQAPFDVMESVLLSEIKAMS